KTGSHRLAFKAQPRLPSFILLDSGIVNIIRGNRPYMVNGRVEIPSRPHFTNSIGGIGILFVDMLPSQCRLAIGRLGITPTDQVSMSVGVLSRKLHASFLLQVP